MVKVRLQNGIIVVEGSEVDKIFEWEHSLFFTTLQGYEQDEANHRYVFSDKKRLIKGKVSF